MGDIKYSSLKVRERGKTQFYYDDKKVPGIFAGEIPPYSKFTLDLSNLQYPFLNGQWVLGDGSLWYDDTLAIQSGSLPSGEDATYWKRDNLDFYLIYYVATNQWEIFSGITPQAGFQLTTGDTVNEDFNIFQSQNVVNNKVYPLCGLNNGATSGFNITIEYQNAPLLCDNPCQFVLDFPDAPVFSGVYTKLDDDAMFTNQIECTGNTTFWYRSFVREEDGFNRNIFIAKTSGGNFRQLVFVDENTNIECGYVPSGSSLFSLYLQAGETVNGSLYPKEGTDLVVVNGFETYSLTFQNCVYIP